MSDETSELTVDEITHPCGACGEQLPEHMEFCTQCGARQPAVADVQPEVATTLDDVPSVPSAPPLDLPALEAQAASLVGESVENASNPRPMFGRPSEALSGALHLSGFPDGPPNHIGFSLGDTSTAVMGAYGVLAALHDRERIGAGQIVDLALFETLFRMIEWHIPAYDQLGIVTQRAGNRFPLGLMVGNVYQSSDGKWLSMSAAADTVIRRMLTLIGGEALADDPRFATTEARNVPENLEALLAAVGDWIAARPAQEVLDEFERAGAVIALVHDAADIVDSPAYEDREAIVSVDDPHLGPVKMPNAVPRLSASPGGVRWTGPDIGAHNEEVYCGLLGLSKEELEALRESGVI